jgi:glutathione synthase/RimK-type ligase-like ATP-grasp enzyme
MIERDGRYVVKILDGDEGRVVHRSNNQSKAIEVKRVYEEEGFQVEFIDEENL